MTSADRDTVQINLRLPPDMLRQLDERIAEMNEGRRFNKVTRTGLVLALLDRDLRERPSWEELISPPAPAAERRVELDDEQRPRKPRR